MKKAGKLSARYVKCSYPMHHHECNQVMIKVKVIFFLRKQCLWFGWSEALMCKRCNFLPNKLAKISSFLLPS